jgi:alkyl sulfatase BDS1-like metallo-beta-lactamase superfamily hydrolase
MVYTYKERFNAKYKFPKGTPHSLKEISDITGFKLSGLKVIFDKGIGAYKTNPESVRPQVKSPEQWAMARVYSAVMGGKTAVIDASHLEKKTNKK